MGGRIDNKMSEVNHPNHYNTPGRKECIEEMLELFGPSAVYTWCALNAYKYNYRKGLKELNSEQKDISKAAWYVDYAKSLPNKVFVDFNVKQYIENYGSKDSSTEC